MWNSGRSNDADDLFEDLLQKRGEMLYSSSARGPPANEVDDDVDRVLVISRVRDISQQIHGVESDRRCVQWFSLDPLTSVVRNLNFNVVGEPRAWLQAESSFDGISTPRGSLNGIPSPSPDCRHRRHMGALMQEL